MIENLREPLESKEVVISRAKAQLMFPAAFMLVAAMNPCPCGYFGSTNTRHECRCKPDQIKRYRQKISGPILDRIDIHIPINATMDMNSDAKEESSHIIKQRVIKAREKQMKRQRKTNAFLLEKEIKQHCSVDDKSQQFLKNAIDKLGLSNRAYHRIIKVSRTISDLANSENIQQHHIAEALSLRNFERSS